ncbi:GTP-binding protein [Aquisphaera insulae]|uniref:GTP-binding protein n=1 Tax=Aquisphaera insulae TaxID=2712864 RepID=UPI0013EAACB3|nr:GTP-binding protein [Aquisphaera insulae]
MGQGPVRFLLVGGFLGAGKTTAVARLARMYRDRGLKVGIITNDQTDNLVDTLSLRAQGFEVGEVAGACFCCNFDVLTRSARQLVAQGRPDVILAEPVGSCTDLVATVVRPLMKLFGGEFEVGRFCVLLKPEYGKLVLQGDPETLRSGTSYIFGKQLEEADIIALNKVDAFTEEDLERLSDLARTANPGATLLPISARTGDGFESLLELLETTSGVGEKGLEVDYDRYADGEAELGWLNAVARVSGEEPFSLDGLVLSVVQRIGERVSAEGSPVAHLKASGSSGPLQAVANLVDGRGKTLLSIAAGGDVESAEITINARVAIDPEVLSDVVREALVEACDDLSLGVDIRDLRSFRPGRPVPIHRMASLADTIG